MVQETVVVEDIYRGGGYNNNRWGEQVTVSQTAYAAEPVYGMNANMYMNNTGMGNTYYCNNETLLIDEQMMIGRNRRRRNTAAAISVVILISLMFFLIFFLI